MFVNFKKIVVIHDGVYGVLDVVRLLRIFGNQRIEREIAAVGGIAGRAARRVFQIVGWKKAEKFADHGAAVGIIAGNEMRHAAFFIVSHGAAKLLLGYLFVSDGFD